LKIVRICSYLKQHVLTLRVAIYSCEHDLDDTDGWHDSHHLAWSFVTLFMERLQPSIQGSSQSFNHMRSTVRNVLHDLLAVLYLPEHPAAELLLYLFVVQLIQIVQGDNVSDVQSNDRLREFAIQLLGSIAYDIRQQQISIRNNPLIIRTHRAIDGLNENGTTPLSNTEIIDCVCGFHVVNGKTVSHIVASTSEEVERIQGGWFVDCDECHVWFHGRSLFVLQLVTSTGCSVLYCNRLLHGRIITNSPSICNDFLVLLCRPMYWVCNLRRCAKPMDM